MKRIALSFGDTTVRGEAVVTRAGLEGGGIYALSAPLREADRGQGRGDRCTLDLRPDITPGDLEKRLSRPRAKQSLSTFLRKARSWRRWRSDCCRSCAITFSQPLNALDPADLAQRIKAVPVRLTGVAPIDKAISTAGGIAWDEVDEHMMLRRRPGTFVAGEMLDWDAPTGGYLLQASFATGAAAGRGALDWLASARKRLALAALDLLAQDLQLQPLLLGRRQLRLGGGERCWTISTKALASRA